MARGEAARRQLQQQHRDFRVSRRPRLGQRNRRAPQNQRNYAWRDYGNRVGLWNYLDVLDEYGVPGSHNVNSMALEECPEIVERINARGDE